MTPHEKIIREAERNIKGLEHDIAIGKEPGSHPEIRHAVSTWEPELEKWKHILYCVKFEEDAKKTFEAIHLAINTHPGMACVAPGLKNFILGCINQTLGISE